MNDDDLIRLFVELTGASEERARSVLIHLDLYRYLRVQSTASRQRAPVSSTEWQTKSGSTTLRIVEAAKLQTTRQLT